MPRWLEEFGPDYDCRQLPDGWTDESWQHDASPSYHVGDLVIWLDHPLPESRVLVMNHGKRPEDTKRFTVCRHHDRSDGKELFCTDRWDEVLEFVRGYESRRPT